jgi:hypothetical protein
MLHAISYELVNTPDIDIRQQHLSQFNYLCARYSIAGQLQLTPHSEELSSQETVYPKALHKSGLTQVLMVGTHHETHEYGYPP